MAREAVVNYSQGLNGGRKVLEGMVQAMIQVSKSQEECIHELSRNVDTLNVSLATLMVRVTKLEKKNSLLEERIQELQNENSLWHK